MKVDDDEQFDDADNIGGEEVIVDGRREKTPAPGQRPLNGALA